MSAPRSAPATIALGAADVAIGVDDAERRMNVLERDAENLQARDRSRRPAGATRSRTSRSTIRRRSVKRSSSRARPIAARTADSASGRNATSGSAVAKTYRRKDSGRASSRYCADAASSTKRPSPVIKSDSSSSTVVNQRSCADSHRTGSDDSEPLKPIVALRVRPGRNRVTLSKGTGQRRCKPGPKMPAKRPCRRKTPASSGPSDPTGSRVNAHE